MAKAALTRRALLLGSAALPLAGGARAQSRMTLSFGTAGQGSAFLAFGQAVKPVVERYAALVLELRETRGSNENAQLVDAGEIQLGTLNMGPAFEAWNGTGKKPRAVLPMNVACCG